MMRHLLCGAVISIAWIMAVGCSDTTGPVPSKYFVFSFEDSMQGWEAHGIDLDTPDVRWSVDLSTEEATDGKSSVRLFLNNINDKSKIWIERAFAVDTLVDYEVDVRYKFASPDWGDANHWTIIAGALSHSAEAVADLTFQGNTANGRSSDTGPEWLDKAYKFNVRSNAKGEVFVQLGVWGNTEFYRAYFIDEVRVILTEK
ncbi:MAG TPA: hypothetical protein VMU02_11640 [bacterium]|nr:hypothetical protein [bacterium]